MSGDGTCGYGPSGRLRGVGTGGIVVLCCCLCASCELLPLRVVRNDPQARLAQQVREWTRELRRWEGLGDREGVRRSAETLIALEPLSVAAWIALLRSGAAEERPVVRARLRTLAGDDPGDPRALFLGGLGASGDERWALWEKAWRLSGGGLPELLDPYRLQLTSLAAWRAYQSLLEVLEPRSPALDDRLLRVREELREESARSTADRSGSGIVETVAPASSTPEGLGRLEDGARVVQRLIDRDDLGRAGERLERLVEVWGRRPPLGWLQCRLDARLGNVESARRWLKKRRDGDLPPRTVVAAAILELDLAPEEERRSRADALLDMRPWCQGACDYERLAGAARRVGSGSVAARLLRDLATAQPESPHAEQWREAAALCDGASSEPLALTAGWRALVAPGPTAAVVELEGRTVEVARSVCRVMLSHGDPARRVIGLRIARDPCQMGFEEVSRKLMEDPDERVRAAYLRFTAEAEDAGEALRARILSRGEADPSSYVREVAHALRSRLGR